MHQDDLLRWLRADSATVARLAPDALEREVPSCPGWDVSRLVGHLGRVHRMALGAVEAGTADPPEGKPERPPEGPEVVPWFADGADRLVSALAATDPEQPAWNFTRSHHQARFWSRRMSHETAVHRWDAEQAITGRPVPIEAAQAVDAIDEYLRIFLPVMPGGAPDPRGEDNVRFVANDTGDEWVVTFTPEGPVVEAGYARADAVGQGRASDVLLFIWGRLPRSILETHGDASRLDRCRPA